jgi:hypothetical protein
VGESRFGVPFGEEFRGFECPPKGARCDVPDLGDTAAKPGQAALEFPTALRRQRAFAVRLSGAREARAVAGGRVSNDQNVHRSSLRRPSGKILYGEFTVSVKDSSQPFFNLLKDRICERLRIDNFHYVEIESKKRVLPSQAKDLKKFLEKKADDQKSSFFLDQFLDTPARDLFKKGASLRLRYKRNGSQVYLQYKGPGFREDGLLYRSEFSSLRLRHLILEESHHDMIHFNRMPIRKIIAGLPREMKGAMRLHLGQDVINRITVGPILCTYQKEKFTIKKGSAFLEPSLDRIFAFQINGGGLHPLSTFWEYENEIKAKGESLDAKLVHLPDLLEFDRKVQKRFDLKAEPLDKYHRCTSIFLPNA